MLTGKQKEVLLFIQQYINDNGYAPSRVDVASEFSMNPTAAQDHIKAIAKKGYIEITPKVSRGIKILKRVKR